MDKKDEIFKLKVEMEKQRFERKCIEAKYKRDMAELSQRWVFETIPLTNNVSSKSFYYLYICIIFLGNINRVVLEGLFRKVAMFFENNATVAIRTTSLRSALEASSMENYKKKNILSGMQAEMATINEALQNDAIREEAWLLLNFPPSLALPIISSILLYGNVSTEVHLLPNFKAVFISSDVTQSRVDFYKCAVLSLGGG